MSNPSPPAPNASDPALHVTSAPSLKTVRKGSKMLLILLLLLAVSAVGALVLTGKLYVDKRNEFKKEAEQEQIAAMQPRRLNVQAASINTYAVAPQEEEGVMHFSLFSTPSGAEVYRDGVLMGTTPIEQQKLPKENKSSSIAIVLNGYEVSRKTVSMAENFSAAVQLREVVIKQPKVAAPPKAEEGVKANQAIMITTQENKPPAKGKRGGKKAEAAPTVSDDIALPD